VCEVNILTLKKLNSLVKFPSQRFWDKLPATAKQFRSQQIHGPQNILLYEYMDMQYTKEQTPCF